MIDKRLWHELKGIPFYMVKVTTAVAAVVFFSLLLNFELAGLIDRVLFGLKDTAALGRSVLLLLAIILTKISAGFLFEHLCRTDAIKIQLGIRKRLIDHFFAMGPVRLRMERSAVMTSTAQEGVERIEPYFSEFIPQLIQVGVSAPILLIVVMSQDLICGGIMLVTLPLIPVFMILIGKMAAFIQRKQWKSLQQMNGHFLDVLRGLTTLRMFGRIERQGEVMKEVHGRFRDRTLEVLRMGFLSALVLEWVATLSTAVIAVSLGIRLLYGQIDFHTAFLILLLTPEYYQPIRQLGAKYHIGQNAKAAADSIYETFEKPVTSWRADKAEYKMARHLKMEIENLTFSFDSASPVLTGVNLTIEPGELIALIGRSGSGKSTMAALLMDFIQGEGRIRVNGVDIRDIGSDQWTGHFAYVPQNPYLYRDSLWANLTMGAPGASQEQVQAVLRQLGLDGLLKELPEGFATMMGEGGRQLSGGQLQRIALARAILKDAPFLILDEPTSALDPETQARIHDVIGGFKGEKTILVIAHRLQTIRQADRIALLVEGKIRMVPPDSIQSGGEALYQALEREVAL